MLILIDPEFLETQSHARLLKFLRSPFSDESCEWIDEVLPELADVYRAMVPSTTGWASANDKSLVNQAMEIFQPVQSVNGQPLALMPPHLSASQVVLLQEELRDREEWSRRTLGATAPVAKSHRLAVLALRGAALHEAVLFVLAGHFAVRRERQMIEFLPTDSGKACIRNRTLGFNLEAQSNLALRWNLRALIEHLRTRHQSSSNSVVRMLQPNELDLVVTRLLDSQFSIGRAMQKDAEIKNLVAAARSLCRWFAVLEIARLAGESEYHPNPEESARLGLDLNLLEHVLSSQVSQVASNQGIYKTANGGVTLGGSSLEHAITCCKHLVLDDPACVIIGHRFEHFVRSYIETEVPPDDYVVVQGFKQSGSDKGTSYDCDLILFEPTRRKIFFVQVKWKRDSRTASLDDELLNWRNKNWPMTKGVSQLASLRARLSEPRVLDQVRNALSGIRLSTEEILTNAHFIVVHTLPFFSAYQVDGVAIYEWNLFRNLLQRGAMRRQLVPDGNPGIASTPEQITHDGLLPVEDPEAVLMYYARELGASDGMYEPLAKAREEARYGFDVELNQVPLWRRMLGKRSVRVLRPYL